MKITIALLFLTVNLLLFGQIPAPTNYYPFTNGSIAGLTQVGTAATQATDRVNSATDAISLNGGYLTRGAFNSANISVSYWVKTTTVDGQIRTIINQTSGNKGWYTYLQNGKIGFGASYEHGQQVSGVNQQFFTGYTNILGTSTVADGYWHNVIVTAAYSLYFDGAGYVKRYIYTIYVDGVQENTATVIRGSNGSFTNIYADLCWDIPVSFAMNLPNKYVDKLDDVRFYGSIVNAAGIAALAHENYCPHPENVTFTSTTVNSTIVNWATSYDAASWDLTYVLAGQPIANGTTISGITATSEFINGLTNNTAYDVYLKSTCSSLTSAVSPAATFTTLCESSSTAAMANNLTIQLDATGNASITAAQVNNNSLTSCGVPANVSIDISTFNCSNIGPNTVTLTATDNLANSSTATSIVTVLPPAIAQNINAYLDASGNVTIDPSAVDNGSNAVCSSTFALSLDQTNFTCANKGANNVVLSVNDGNGNIGTATATITVLDTLAPTVITRDVTISLDANYQGTIIPSMINNGSTDNCSGALTYTLSKTNFSCDDQGANTVQLTVTDVAGNSATGSATVTVNQVFADVSLSATETQFCDNATASTDITTGSSAVGVTYSLRDQNNTVIDGPIAGTGNPIVFNTGTISGNTTYHVYAEKQSIQTNNFGLDFNGTNNVVNTNLTMPTTSTFTIESWVYPRSANYDRLISNYTGNIAGHMVIDTYNATDNGRGLRAYIVGPGNVPFSVGVPNVLSLNSWNHIAVTFNSGAVKIFVNGIQVQTGTAPFTSFPTHTNTFCFGEDPVINTAEYLNGKLDDIRFWNTAKTASQILDGMNDCLAGNESNLLAYYNLENGSGTVATDLVAGKNGNLTNMTGAAWVSGAFACSSNCTFEMTQTVTVGIGQSQSRSENVSICSGSDYTFPDGTTQTNITSAVAYTSTLQTLASGCDSIIVTNLTIKPTYNLTASAVICSGANYTFPDGNLALNVTAQIIHTSNMQTLAGCDSIIVTTLDVNPVYNLTETATICSGADYTFPDGTTQTNITTQVVHTSNLQTTLGCDSIIVSTINVNPTYFINEALTICAGSNYTFPDGTTQSNITAQVVHTSNLQTTLGCDSIVETTLNVNPSYNLTETVAICSGADYTFPDGTTQTNITTQQVYTSNLQTLLGCDSILVTTVTVNPFYNITENVTLCSGADYTFPDGTTQTNITAQVVYTSNLQTIAACDSIIVTTIDVNPIYNLSETAAICSGGSYTFPDGTTTTNITAQVVYSSNLLTVAGCDSIVETTVNVNPVYNSTQSVLLCEGSSYTFPDGTTVNDINSTLVYTSNLQTALGCDSIIVSTVNVNPTQNTNETVSVCFGSDYTFPDGTTQTNLTAQTSHTSLLNSLVTGCDSLITTLVLVEGPFNMTETVAICSGSAYTFPDGTTQTNITTEVVHTSVLQTQNLGCDSTIVTTLTVDVLDPSVSVNNNVITANQSGATYQWIDCDNGNAPISGEESQNFAPTVNGNYACILNEGTPCSVTTACTEITTLGTEQLTKHEIILFPNPTASLLNIQVDGEIIEIEIHNLAGEIIQREKENSFSVEGLAKGSYFVSVKTNLGIFRTTFVKS